MTLHVTPGKQGVNIEKDKYDAMRRAILKVVARNRTGIAFRDLPRLVKPHLPAAIFRGASVTWYTVTVKLDLEARGLIERIDGVTPQRLRRK
jgi:hypothetical protein